jgi:hypothetical protein
MQSVLPNNASPSLFVAFGLIAASLQIAASPVNALTLYQSQVTCPINGDRFTATLVSSFHQQGMRLDSKPEGNLVAPYPYPVCPENGFVIYKDDFAEGELLAIKAIVKTEEYRRARGEHTDYYMIAYVMKRLGNDQYDLGNLYLQASWEAEGKRSLLARQYQALAIEHFDTFLKHNATITHDWWIASILAAELNRLVGNFGGVEARLSNLPPAPDAILKQVIDQIRSHARNRNSNHEDYKERAEGTMECGDMR